MRRFYILLFSIFLLIGLKASAQDYILIPEKFYPHKGDKLNIHLISANQFIKQDEIGFDPNKIEKFTAWTGSKKNDKEIATKNGDTIATVQIEKDGLTTIVMNRKAVTDDIERDDLSKIMDDEGLTQLSEKVKNGSKDSYREKYTWSLKSLVEADKPSGNDFDKSVSQEYEIILKDNPYKGNYGDDITALVTFRGKPAVTATVLFYIRTADGNVFVQKLSSDKQGLIYFKLSREGIYLLRSMHMEASKDNNVDYYTWLTTYTFSFTSSNEAPNVYKSFGLGNKH